MRWHLLAAVLNLWLIGLRAEGNIGCLFSARVCNGREEWCHNDHAFGQCIQSYIDPSDDLYRYQLEKSDLEVLQQELVRLNDLGFRWTHPYTQCALQSVLHTIRFHLKHEVSEECLRYLVGDDEDEQGYEDDDDVDESMLENEGPQEVNDEDVAFVSFMPSENNPNAEFADEVYIPPLADDNAEHYDEDTDTSFQLLEPQMNLPEKKSDGDQDVLPIDANSLLIGPFPSLFDADYNTPDLFRAGKEVRDEYGIRDNEIPYIFTQHDNRPGGSDTLEQTLDDGLDLLLNEMQPKDDGFERQERLDVKKPGPQYGTNNFYFRKEGNHGYIPDLQETGHFKSQDQNVNNSSYKRKTPTAANDDVTIEGDFLHQEKDYDYKDYVYIECYNSFQNWGLGVAVVKEIETLLGLPNNTLKNIKINYTEVAFQVGSNPYGFNASQVALRIADKIDELQERRNIRVIEIGIAKEGFKNKIPLIRSTKLRKGEEFYVIMFSIIGLCAAVVVAGAILFVIRLHARSREKLQGLSAPDAEISKDYQDLCRAHMSTKAQQEKSESTHVPQRIASLSRESEGSNNSPSSRSSTSSWSEEPALANIDISTGHMVLAYMEDHLKNKDRLDQEWLGLCAYEAEPCAASVAQTPENFKKNRYPDILPYDHARVVLNDLTNMTGSDYINASTITDHDPRNPAYIATQGPLPHTAADFWQMVWEQGSVVMVMLTRLTENGTAMCHRYWPEEGSELYHIYEVHLVSEHIWCDDYLVRSFYLKNLKTGETRTVTQFHFLSWFEGGVPPTTKSLLEFRRKVNKSYRGRSCPIVIHCSDGAGRSGTYCLIDMVLNRMAKGAKEIDIAATLEHIRDQRPQMVRTKQQFEFVLTAVAEEVNAILKAQPSQQAPAVSSSPGQ